MRIIVASGTALGLIYSLGRMLGFKLSDLNKNRIAFVWIFFANYVISMLYYHPTNLLIMVWETVAFSLIAVVLYVVIGWKLYSRLDSWLDKKGFVDKKNR